MSKQYPGGIISKTPVTPSGPYENSTASGIWTLDQQAYWRKLNQWPIAGSVEPDPQFNYVTMLLHGDGTNGAQNNTFLDSSASPLTITRNGNTTQGSFSPYGSNWSNFFGTANDNALLFTELTLSSNFTIETWIYPTAQSSSGYTITFSASSAAEQIMYYYTDGRIGCYFQNGANGISSTGKLSMNVWSHVAVVRSGSTVKIYVNGVDTGVSISGSSTVTVGTISGYTTGSGYNVYGYLSNVRIGTTAVYTSNFTPPTAPLTAITGTLLLTCQSNRYVDNSTSARAITTLGTPSVQRFNPFGASTAYSTSVIGGSGYFDGTGDYLTTPSSSALGFGTGDFTIECWTYLRDNNALYVFDMRFSSGADTYVYINASTLEAAVNGVSLSVSGVNFLNNWSHIAIVRASGTVKIYVNGVQQATASSSGSIANSGIAVGARYTGSESFNGYISNFRIVKGTAVYTSAFTPPTAPLTAISGTSLLLSTINGAIFDNAMMNDLETVGNAQISTSVVKYGTGSLYFDGTGDYLQLPVSQNFNFGYGDFTIEGWVNLPSVGATFKTIFATGYTVQIYENSGTIYTYLNDSDNTTSYIINGLAGPTSAISANTWAHFAVVRNGSTFTCYINGVAGTPMSSSGNVLLSATAPTVGSTIVGTAYPLTGYIDDLRITKGYARYTANFTPPTAAFQNIGPT